MCRHHLTATVFDRRGRILATGQNDYLKTHPIQQSFANRVGLDKKSFLHAEILALIRAQKVGTPHKIKIERYGKSGKPLLAKPCPICELAIKEAGIKFVEFTIGE